MLWGADPKSGFGHSQPITALVVVGAIERDCGSKGVFGPTRRAEVRRDGHSDPNPRLAWDGDGDRCPVTWDDVVVEANIVGVWRTPIGWAVYGAVAAGGGSGSVRRTHR